MDNNDNHEEEMDDDKEEKGDDNNHRLVRWLVRPSPKNIASNAHAHT